MQILMFVEDNSIAIDQKTYSRLDLTPCNIPANVRVFRFNTSSNLGNLEFNDGTKNENLNALPFWGTSCIDLWTQADAAAKIFSDELLIMDCKFRAQIYLQETDWVELPSVTDVNSVPHLLNKSDFVAYRSAVRILVIDPITNPVFPTAPKAIWSQ